MAARRHDIAPRDLARLGSGDSLDPVAQCALALRSRAADALDQLWRAAEVAVRDESFARDFELALILIHLFPALGLLVARRCHAEDDWMTEVPANVADEARAELGLAGEDGTRHIQAAVRREEVDANARATGLRAALDLSLDRNRELERRIHALEDQLRRQAAAPTEPVAPPDPAEVRAQRAKIEDLQERIRERDGQLALAQRKLGEVSGAAPAAPTPPPGPPKRR